MKALLEATKGTEYNMIYMFHSNVVAANGIEIIDLVVLRYNV